MNSMLKILIKMNSQLRNF